MSPWIQPTAGPQMPQTLPSDCCLCLRITNLQAQAQGHLALDHNGAHGEWALWISIHCQYHMETRATRECKLDPPSVWPQNSTLLTMMRQAVPETARAPWSSAFKGPCRSCRMARPGRIISVFSSAFLFPRSLVGGTGRDFLLLP